VTHHEKLICLSQTTLSVYETEFIRAILKNRFQTIIFPKHEDICYATQQRQEDVQKLARLGANPIIVVGSPTSSNSKQLAKAAQNAGAQSFLISDYKEVTPAMIGCSRITGVTAGASTPMNLVNDLIANLTSSPYNMKLYDLARFSEKK
jgi:4-hydroxy-3-methylbut-2-en-1-yl diphosphate reductase